MIDFISDLLTTVIGSLVKMVLMYLYGNETGLLFRVPAITLMSDKVSFQKT
jgi:hypothetical protein